MLAGGAQLGCLGANNDMAAVTALPDLDLALLKDLSSFNVIQQSAVTLLVVLLDSGDQTELAGQFIEAILNILGKINIFDAHFIYSFPQDL